MIVEFYEDVVQISGSLKSNFWDTIHTAISLALKKHPHGVIVDCSGITECTVEGADTFIDAMDYIGSQDARIILAAVPASVLEILKAVPEVRSQLAIAASVDEARRSLDLPVHEYAKKTTSPQQAVQMAVQLMGTPCDRAALEAATQLARVTSAQLHLVFPIIVPRDLPLQSPLPTQEQLAITTIEAAKVYLKELHLPCSVHLERGRDLASALLSVCEANEISTAFVPLPCLPEDREAAMQIARSTLNKLNCTVLLVRGHLTS